MNKSELKTGMWVEYRDGRIKMVALKTDYGDILCGGGTWNELSNYDENWNSKTMSILDIIKIFKPNSLGAFNAEPETKNIIWQRTEAKEITSEEAFSILKKHYGCEVKIKE